MLPMLLCPVIARALAGERELVLACKVDSDLYQVLKASGMTCPRYDAAGQAVGQAPSGATVMILADGYPEQTTELAPALLEKAAAKDIRLYVEYPTAVPGLEVGPPRETQWERVVVSTDIFGPALPRLRILMVHGCRFVPAGRVDCLLVAGRVAGFDRAVFGLPSQLSPILFELPQQRLVVATTKLSAFVTGRYAPASDWQVFWQQMLGRLTDRQAIALRVTPIVTPAYGPADPLPADVERRSLAAFTRWAVDARLLVHSSREAEIHRLLTAHVEAAAAPGPGAPSGDGSLGLLEGFESLIAWDGSQKQRLPLRCDCHAEMAACMALDWAVNHNAGSRRIAENLLDFVFFKSEAMRGPRGDPTHPAFGHVAWGLIAPAWQIAHYGDDNARVVEGAIVAAACLKSDRWDEPILRALLANLRTTGRLGFRGERIDLAPLERRGWRPYHDADTIDLCAHYEAGLWACFLWAHRHTGHRPFLEKAKNGIRRMMEAYPGHWRWQNNLERVRMVHCLAWLVRVEDTPEHRDWLRRMCADLLACQDPANGAVAEVIGAKGSAHFLPPMSNEEYGTREMPIIQDSGDRASDQLYVTGFTLLVLHEANAVLGDPRLKTAEDRLAEYLCRIQVRADRIPYLNGGWFRAFCFGRWEYWASSGDAGWGAWSMEAGWGQAWAAATMGLRALNTTVWDLTGDSKIDRHLPAVQQLMAVNKGGPWQSTTPPRPVSRRE
ncbi:MAG TPA: hypothetical protein PKY77_04925 [Phycisphaerae bacterium]|nr:hypothetical protein [Phycisphaerae bacterium]HRY67204.1 hypothetical protein [Phycisphaerae bacterium]